MVGYSNKKSKVLGAIIMYYHNGWMKKAIYDRNMKK